MLGVIFAVLSALSKGFEKILRKVLEYVLSLRKLIESHKTEVYLERLHRSVNPEISGWGDKVTELLRKFDRLLICVEQDAPSV